MQVELEATEESSPSDQEVFLRVVFARYGAAVLLALHELASNSATVLVAHFIDLDGVVSAEEGDDEFSGLIIGLGRDEFGVEAQDVHVLLEDLLHVALWGLGSERENAVHGVFLGSVSSVVRDSLVDEVGCGLLELHGDLVNAQVLGVPGLGEVVTGVDQAGAAVNDEFVSALEVGRRIVVFLTEGHAGAMGQNRRLCESLTLEEHGESVLSGVLLGDLLDLDRVVRQEEVEGVELVTAIVGDVLPVDREGEDLAVVLEERVEVAVVTATSELDLVIVLEPFRVWGVLLVVDHVAGRLVGVFGQCFSCSEELAFGVEELAGESVTVVDAEDPLVDSQVTGEADVTPVDGLGCAAVSRHLVALEEDTLGKAGVLLPVLENMDGVVFQVVKHGALVNAEVLVLGLDHGLLEVGVEAEHLKDKAQVNGSVSY